MTSRVRAAAALATATVVTLSLTGCAPSIDDLVRSSLADSVEDTQGTLWEYREGLATDPEQTIAGLGFITDARPGTAAPETYALYTMTDLRSSAEGSMLTLLAAGGAQTGGGWTYDQREAVTCFTLTFPRGENRIETAPADCVDIPRLNDFDEIIPLDELDVRLTVTAADYPPPICQCHSGGDCDCPGG